MIRRSLILIITSAVLALPFAGVSCTAEDKPKERIEPEPEPGPQPKDTVSYTPALGDDGSLDFYETPKPPLNGSTYKILFIGNSLTMDATCFLPQLLNAAGVKNVELTRTYHGAYTLQLYNNNYYNDDICAICTWKPGQQFWVGGSETADSPQTAVEMDKYDFVVMQDYPGNSITWTWSNDEKAAVNGLIGKIRVSQTGSQPEFILHYPHTHGNRRENTTVEHFHGSSAEFFETVSVTMRHLMEETPLSRVISTGALIQSLRTSALNTDPDRDLTRSDDVHMDYGMVRYAAALLIFKQLFTPITRVSINSIPWRFREWFPCEASEYTTPVLDENMPLIYEAIDSAIAYPFSICDFSARPVSTDYDIDATGPEMLDAGISFPGGVSFPLSFPIGNGCNTASRQPYWLPYGIWIAPDWKSYAKWYMASIPNPEINTYRVAYDNGSISSPAVKGVWTDDYFEFRIPVENFAAGTKVQFKAPIYCRQSPVFWAFEWFDEGQWKSNLSRKTSPDGSASAQASFVLNYPYTSVSQTATFSEAIPQGWLRVRLRCIDGSLISTGTGTCSRVSYPTVDAASGVPAGAIYFMAKEDCQNVSFDIIQ